MAMYTNNAILNA